MEVWSLRLSKNQKYLISAGGDGKARLWDLRRGDQVRMLTCNSQSSSRTSCGRCKAVFLSNDTFVATISDDDEHRDVRFHDCCSGSIIGDLKHHTRYVQGTSLFRVG